MITNQKLIKLLKNRYIYSILAFLVWMTFIDDTSFIRQYKLSKELRTLIEKKEYYQSETKRIKNNLKLFENNLDAIEKYARERYKMKRENEDILVFNEDIESE